MCDWNANRPTNVKWNAKNAKWDTAGQMEKNGMLVQDRECKKNIKSGKECDWNALRMQALKWNALECAGMRIPGGMQKKP